MAAISMLPDNLRTLSVHLDKKHGGGFPNIGDIFEIFPETKVRYLPIISEYCKELNLKSDLGQYLIPIGNDI